MRMQPLCFFLFIQFLCFSTEAENARVTSATNPILFPAHMNPTLINYVTNSRSMGELFLLLVPP